MATGTESSRASPSKTHAGSRGLAPLRARRPSASRDSSHGVRPKSPLHRYEYVASTPGGPPRGPAFGPKLPRSELVPPLSFHPTSTVYSAPYRAGLLHPAAGREVRQVSGPRCRPARRRGGGARPPRWRRPFEAFPSLAAFPRCRVLGPLAVAASVRLPAALPRLGLARCWLDLRALLRQRVRCAGPRCRRPSPDAPLGLEPRWGVRRIRAGRRSALAVRPPEPRPRQAGPWRRWPREEAKSPTAPNAPERAPCRPGRTARLATAALESPLWLPRERALPPEGGVAPGAAPEGTTVASRSAGCAAASSGAAGVLGPSVDRDSGVPPKRRSICPIRALRAELPRESCASRASRYPKKNLAPEPKLGKRQPWPRAGPKPVAAASGAGTPSADSS